MHASTKSKSKTFLKVITPEQLGRNKVGPSFAVNNGFIEVPTYDLSSPTPTQSQLIYEQIINSQPVEPPWHGLLESATEGWNIPIIQSPLQQRISNLQTSMRLEKEKIKQVATSLLSLQKEETIKNVQGFKEDVISLSKRVQHLKKSMKKQIKHNQSMENREVSELIEQMTLKDESVYKRNRVKSGIADEVVPPQMLCKSFFVCSNKIKIPQLKTIDDNFELEQILPDQLKSKSNVYHGRAVIEEQIQRSLVGETSHSLGDALHSPSFNRMRKHMQFIEDKLQKLEGRRVNGFTVLLAMEKGMIHGDPFIIRDKPNLLLLLRTRDKFVGGYTSMKLEESTADEKALLITVQPEGVHLLRVNQSDHYEAVGWNNTSLIGFGVDLQVNKECTQGSSFWPNSYQVPTHLKLQEADQTPFFTGTHNFVIHSLIVVQLHFPQMVIESK